MLSFPLNCNYIVQPTLRFKCHHVQKREQKWQNRTKQQPTSIIANLWIISHLNLRHQFNLILKNSYFNWTIIRMFHRRTKISNNCHTRILLSHNLKTRKWCMPITFFFFFLIGIPITKLKTLTATPKKSLLSQKMKLMQLCWNSTQTHS